MVTRLLTIPPDPDLQQADLRHTATLLGSSVDRDWRGVGVLHAAVKTQPTFAAVPEAYTRYMPVVVLHHKSVVKLRCRTPRRLYETISHPGGVCLMPLNFDGAWSWHGNAELVHIFLTPDLTTSIADEVGRTDPERIAFGEHFDRRDAFVQHIGEALLSELHTPGYGGRLYAESLSATLALHLLRNYADFAIAHTPSQRGLPPLLVRRVIDHIHDRLEQDLALADLAAVVGLSPSYFLRQFKAATGLAPHQYVVQQRVTRAKQLLLSGQHTIAEVAHLAGFSDQSHLHRHFKRAFGVAPRDVLQDRKNIHSEGEDVLQDRKNIHSEGEIVQDPRTIP